MALPEPPPPADLRIAAQRVNRAMFFVGAACAVVGFRFFFLPAELARTSVGRALHGPFDDLWSGLYLVGGIAIMVGVAGRRPRLELPGITLATTATLVNGVAIFLTNGSRAWSQLPLYVLALWVFDGRARDLRDLPRERPRRRPGSRAEQRIYSAAPVWLVLLAADTASPPNTNLLVTILVALLGGGIFTAAAQLLLYRPQRRTLEGNLSKTAVETAGAALAAANARVDELERDLEEERRRRRELEHRVDELESLKRGLEVQATRDHETIATLLERTRRMQA